ncbi:MarR family transcriptional regulator [Galbitalea sp. SE-J8]|uniref:MarR family winged helix-turn-helix transcriptional regulator n=1 Tax=Galbitalea sp. SE-J8 TaxID=3054952 RepID=UPI00259C7E9B|nr:MarR family transcriptional regulator [Galbitalea sp. SE-J8]MDM4763944.1 MarR family transcriptional regulator [Galbitalea sp. SE-J8]
MPNPSAELRHTIMRISRRLRQEHLDGVGDGQRSVLFFLVDAGPQSLGALAEQDRVTPPSMNRTVGLLVERGYLTREPAPDDARRVRIDVTDAGLAWVRETRRRRDVWFADRLARLSPEERELLARAEPVLRRLAEL